MKPMDANQMKTGATVTSAPTSEEYDEEEHPSKHHFHGWMNSEHAPYDDDAGDDNKVFAKALHYLQGRVHPGDMEHHAHHMSKMFHGGFDEAHNDLISQGNQDVGGDATDEFIKDVVVKPHMPGSYQAEDNALLDKMLTIAGLR
jgi:hypothetical protein